MTQVERLFKTIFLISSRLFHSPIISDMMPVMAEDPNLRASDVPRLCTDACRARCRALGDRLRVANLDSALICDPRSVNRYTGYFRPGRAIFMVGLLVKPDGQATLLVPTQPADGEVAHTDETLVYDSFNASLVVEDQSAALVARARDRLANVRRLGMDLPVHRVLLPAGIERIEDVRDDLLRLRRRKDDDEVELIRAAIALAESAYARARQLIRPGVDEVDLYAEMLAVATRAAGEPLSEFGNDFQFNAFASLPRRRAAQAGETIALDVTVGIRGYTCDLCRTFVAGQASDAQRDAHAQVCRTLEQIESLIRPGLSCGQLFAEIKRRLDGHRGWKFFHHLGHGVGAWSIERPRINDGSPDLFEPGDVFAVEPALYDQAALRMGVRVEDNYALSESGLVRLSQFPRDLYCGE